MAFDIITDQPPKKKSIGLGVKTMTHPTISPPGEYEDPFDIYADEIEMIKENGHSAEQYHEVANMLNNAFGWSGTPQGSDYWQNVYKNLLDLAYFAELGEQMEEEVLVP